MAPPGPTVLYGDPFPSADLSWPVRMVYSPRIGHFPYRPVLAGPARSSRGGPGLPHPGERIMPDLQDGESVEMQGSGSKPYVLKNVGGVYSCSCPAWRNQSVGIERRTCKHLRKLRGDAAEESRIGSAMPAAPVKPASAKDTTPALLLAESWDNERDLAGWWMSEKLDGVRAFWDGKQFLS